MWWWCTLRRRSAVNFTNILRAAFAPFSLRPKLSLNFSTKQLHIRLSYKKLLKKCWWNWHPSNFDTDSPSGFNSTSIWDPSKTRDIIKHVREFKLGCHMIFFHVFVVICVSVSKMCIYLFLSQFEISCKKQLSFKISCHIPLTDPCIACLRGRPYMTSRSFW